MKLYRMLLAAALAAWALLPGPAGAWYDVCNKSSYDELVIAFGYWGEAEGKWVSEGWWRASPGECVTVHDGPLKKTKYYVYAESDDGDYEWSGDYYFCVSDDVFTIVGDTDCKSRGYYSEGFFEVDVGESPDWTTDLID